MNKFVAILILAVIVLSSCEKEQLNGSHEFGEVQNYPVRLKDSVIDKVGNQMTMYVEFTYLMDDALSYGISQGVRDNNFEIGFPNDINYTFNINSIHLIPENELNNSSNLILFDKSEESTFLWDFDDCLNYWVQNMEEGHEYAFGAFNSELENQFKIYDPGFTDANTATASRTDLVYNMYGEDAKGEANQLQAILNAMDYLDSNAQYENKNIILITNTFTDEGGGLALDVVNKANSKNIRVNVIGHFDYDYAYISSYTDGFYAETLYGNFEGVHRMLMYSIPKLAQQKYSKFEVELEITRNVGVMAFTLGYWFQVDDSYIIYYGTL